VKVKRSLELIPLLPIPQGEWTKDLGWLKEEIVKEREEAVKEGKTELVDHASDREVRRQNLNALWENSFSRLMGRKTRSYRR